MPESFSTRNRNRLVSSAANATLRASGMPSVQNVIFQAAKQVSSNPRADPSQALHRSPEQRLLLQVDAPGVDSTSVYENWLKYSNRTSPEHGTIPR